MFLFSDSHSLSILMRTNSLQVNPVKHYRIYRLQNSWYYISPGLTFPSLHCLVEHYSGQNWSHDSLLDAVRQQNSSNWQKTGAPFTEFPNGLCCQLTAPCFIQGLDTPRPVPNTIRRPTINWKDISRWEMFAYNDCSGTRDTHCLIMWEEWERSDWLKVKSWDFSTKSTNTIHEI